MTIRIATLAALAAAALLSACGGGSASGEAGIAEPPLETDVAKLDAALDCTEFTHPDKPPVLLVHGTFTAGFEQYEWTYKPLLVERGYDVCTVTYPDRGLGDMQVSAEYVVHALRRIHAESGRKVAVIGHSQGVAVPRWAIKWWPSARDAVDDFVMQAGPNYGISIAALGSLPLLPALVGLPEVFYQFDGNSAFMQATNRGDQTPGDISYTAMYTQFDELVRPVETAMIEPGMNNPKVTNILIQDICPGRIVEHATIGLVDRVAFELALDAIEHPGPADVERAGGATLCGLLPVVPNLAIAPVPQLLSGLITVMMKEPGNGLPALHLARQEPELKPYALQ
ncbi:MAG TPA: alpha/beta fold hydrolase [Solimonas sp.]